MSEACLHGGLNVPLTLHSHVFLLTVWVQLCISISKVFAALQLIYHGFQCHAGLCTAFAVFLIMSYSVFWTTFPLLI